MWSSFLLCGGRLENMFQLSGGQLLAAGWTAATHTCSFPKGNEHANEPRHPLHKNTGHHLVTCIFYLWCDARKNKANSPVDCWRLGRAPAEYRFVRIAGQFCKFYVIFFLNSFQLFDISILLLYTICVNLLSFGGKSSGKEVESENSGTFR